MASLANLLASRDRKFFDLFEQAAQNAVRTAELFHEMLLDFPDSAHLAKDILLAEQEGDRITHAIIQRLNETFVTPIEREDILELASALDDVVDHTEETADYFVIYKIEASMEQATRLSQILLDATRQIALGVPLLRTFGDISAYTVEIHRLENDGDRISRDAVASLFDGGIDPMIVIRWKDIYARLEDAIDACEQVANIMASIIIKNA
jgi:uncharacterized protein Yka (UPF0111/DUF47 family)